MGKKYLIATACNKKYEEFLINHWLKSLKENVNLAEIDILVLDYGLTENAKNILKENSVIVEEATEFNGHINNLRFKELKKYLEANTKYEQLIFCDSGDIIFQSDILHLFKIENDKVRGVCEEISPNMDVLINNEKVKNADEIKSFLRGKRLINAGFVVYPSHKFINIVNEMFQKIIDPYAWGVDMILLNYFAYKYGFYELPTIYNFIPTTSTKKYFVKDGKFYLKDGTIIPIVHNAGGKKFLRPIRNFGYGKEYNQTRWLIVYLLKIFYKTLSFFRRNK